jgi:hypothetical protein
MGTLIFVCPASGHEVSTGVEVDRDTFRKLSTTGAEISCPHCQNNHALSTIAVWLVSDEVPDESPTLNLLGNPDQIVASDLAGGYQSATSG